MNEQFVPRNMVSLVGQAIVLLGGTQLVCSEA
jgi:hypothetical protein